jgi:hypothetical protein
MMWRGLFGCFDGSLRMGIVNKGRRVHDEHVALVRGLCTGRKANYLEWEVGDGWESLCRFLDKNVPDKPFPHANNRKAFKDREDALLRKTGLRAIRNMLLVIIGAALSLWGLLARKEMDDVEYQP